MQRRKNYTRVVRLVNSIALKHRSTDKARLVRGNIQCQLMALQQLLIGTATLRECQRCPTIQRNFSGGGTIKISERVWLAIFLFTSFQVYISLQERLGQQKYFLPVNSVIGKME